MLRNYLKIALRTLRRQKGYAAINIIGLALGIACCLLIGLYVEDEQTYDRYHERGDRIYRVNQHILRPESETWSAWSGGALAEDLAGEFPEVEALVRLLPAPGVVRRTAGDEAISFRETRFYYADTAFFDVFSHRFLQGNPATALQHPGAVVLTASTARRYFGDEDPMGQLLQYNDNRTMEVTGVIEDVPQNSHLHFDLLAPVSAFKLAAGLAPDAPFGSYWWPYGYTYALLTSPEAAARLEPQLPDFIDRHRPRDPQAAYLPTLQPLFDLHLDQHVVSQPEPGGSRTLVRVFTLIALAVLLLACINFMNLATARSARRAREVGVRKSLGAERRQLVGQFLSESVLLSALALLLALGLVELVLPTFNDFTARTLRLDFVAAPHRWLLLLGLVGLTGLAAGSYPALYLSRFQPVTVLKGQGGGARRSAWLRKSLVVFQFTLSIALMACTLIAVLQLRYMQQTGLGTTQDQTVMLRVEDAQAWPALKAALAARPEVVALSGATFRPGFGRGNTLPYEAEGITFEDGDRPHMGHIQVDYGFFETLGLPLVAGRTFSPDRPADQGYQPDDAGPYYHLFDRALVINEAAAATNGWTPEEALGKAMRIYAFEGGTYYTDIRGTVVGVVQDYHYNPLNEEILPQAFSLSPSPVGTALSWALVQVQPGPSAPMLTALEAAWQLAAPDQPFSPTFLDEALAGRYAQEAQVSRLLGAFALLGLAIACLGLFGLTAFAAEQRTQELGIRKVFGATTPHLVGLLTRDFLVLVLVAAVLSSPLAYWAMTQWLGGFAYRIDISPWLFVGLTAAALALALSTVCYQALRAARRDPVQSLRYE